MSSVLLLGLALTFVCHAQVDRALTYLAAEVRHGKAIDGPL